MLAHDCVSRFFCSPDDTWSKSCNSWIIKSPLMLFLLTVSFWSWTRPVHCDHRNSDPSTINISHCWPKLESLRRERSLLSSTPKSRYPVPGPGLMWQDGPYDINALHLLECLVSFSENPPLDLQLQFPWCRQRFSAFQQLKLQISVLGTSGDLYARACGIFIGSIHLMFDVPSSLLPSISPSITAFSWRYRSRIASVLSFVPPGTFQA